MAKDCRSGDSSGLDIVCLAVAQRELCFTFGLAGGYNESYKGVADSIKGGAIHWIQLQTVHVDQSPISIALELSVSAHQSRVI